MNRKSSRTRQKDVREINWNLNWFSFTGISKIDVVALLDDDNNICVRVRA